MIANNLIQLIGVFMQVAAAAFILLKGWQYFLDNEIKKAEIKLEMVKHNSLTAVQVSDILMHYQSVKREIDEMKASDKIKDVAFNHALNKMEELLDELSQNFTQFLINKAK